MPLKAKYFNPFKITRKVFLAVVSRLPAFRFLRETIGTQTPITFGNWWNQKVMGYAPGAYWPVSKYSSVSGPQNIYAGIEVSPGLMPGCYIQAYHGKIYIGDYTQIAPNVGIISANHALTDNRQHVATTVRIGNYCWIGFGAVILPGVELGEYTIVGANAVVTKSFPEGYCVIAGNPARVVKTLDPSECVKHKSKHEYNGFIPAHKFEAYRKKYLNV
ncbi:MAG: acyltransferase [Chitinophagaceae bacterium]|nr:MAG: acyltransferase [Chitinophagaceae bacterium]